MAKKQVLVIVAHPDDETIWMGGTLLENKDKWNTAIISLCRKKDKDRYLKFKKACGILNAKSFISDLDDSEKGYYEQIENEDIIRRVRNFLKKNTKFDYLFTHGKKGEYGHIRHIEVHKAVKEMLNKKILSAGEVFFFSYEKNNIFCNINKNADKLIKLRNPCFKMKKKLIRDIYGFEKNSFENRCCREKEAFDIKK